MSAAITALITEILTSKYEVPAEEISNESRFEELHLDSLALMEMALVLERELGVRIAEGVITPEQSLHEAASTLVSLSTGD
ncbi:MULTISPECIES: acyl carrier protein [unclassified Nocardiopsis]|uniref:acyl carrier protein n=1 Tax=unclassified Nocardiopsis TaxID=2649073 RepID=UPI00135980C3|nr:MULTISPECIES: acyl carrier protein [unclassified Nocardiopsis]